MSKHSQHKPLSTRRGLGVSIQEWAQWKGKSTRAVQAPPLDQSLENPSSSTQNAHAVTNTNETSRLLTLPAELRLEIYKLLSPATPHKLQLSAGYNDVAIYPYGPILTADEKPLFRLCQVCRTTREEIMSKPDDFLPNFCQRLIAHDLSSACWFGATRLFFAASVFHVEICGGMSVSIAYREKWLTELFSIFPQLDRLTLQGIHAHKNPGVWGTAYKIDDLRMLKFILDNSRLEKVGTVDVDDPRMDYRTRRANYCIEDGRYATCKPEVTLLTSKGYEEQFRYRPERGFVEIAVADELERALSLKRKRSREE